MEQSEDSKTAAAHCFYAKYIPLVAMVELSMNSDKYI